MEGTHTRVCDNEIKVLLFTEERCVLSQCVEKIHLAGGHINCQSPLWVTAEWGNMHQKNLLNVHIIWHGNIYFKNFILRK